LWDEFEVDAQEVISSGKLGYKRTNVPKPGLVGGPCCCAPSSFGVRSSE